MELEIFLLFFLCGCLNGDLDRSRARQKRGVFELASTTECVTGRLAMSYVGYGCYCGLGGQGTPKDATDWCCFRHDCCYGLAELFGCHPHLNDYNWKCVNKTVQCEQTKDKCENITCKCDKELARCLQKSTFKLKYFWYPNSWCGTKNPQCNYHNGRYKRGIGL